MLNRFRHIVEEMRGLIDDSRSASFLMAVSGGVDSMCLADMWLRCFGAESCAIAHCKRFTTGEMKGKCPALNDYLRNHNLHAPRLLVHCLGCKYRTECERRGCAITSDPITSIDRCTQCNAGNIKQTTCNPAPRKIVFHEKSLSAPCPVCNKGTLSPVQNGSFESFIRGLYQFVADGGVGFCAAFQKEIKKVGDIQEILRDDEKGG